MVAGQEAIDRKIDAPTSRSDATSVW